MATRHSDTIQDNFAQGFTIGVNVTVTTPGGANPFSTYTGRRSEVKNHSTQTESGHRPVSAPANAHSKRLPSASTPLPTSQNQHIEIVTTVTPAGMPGAQCLRSVMRGSYPEMCLDESKVFLTTERNIGVDKNPSSIPENEDSTSEFIENIIYDIVDQERPCRDEDLTAHPRARGVDRELDLVDEESSEGEDFDEVGKEDDRRSDEEGLERVVEKLYTCRTKEDREKCKNQLCNAEEFTSSDDSEEQTKDPYRCNSTEGEKLARGTEVYDGERKDTSAQDEEKPCSMEPCRGKEEALTCVKDEYDAESIGSVDGVKPAEDEEMSYTLSPCRSKTESICVKEECDDAVSVRSATSVKSAGDAEQPCTTGPFRTEEDAEKCKKVVCETDSARSAASFGSAVDAEQPCTKGPCRSEEDRRTCQKEICDDTTVPSVRSAENEDKTHKMGPCRTEEEKGTRTKEECDVNHEDPCRTAEDVKTCGKEEHDAEVESRSSRDSKDSSSDICDPTKGSCLVLPQRFDKAEHKSKHNKTPDYKKIPCKRCKALAAAPKKQHKAKPDQKDLGGRMPTCSSGSVIDDAASVLSIEGRKIFPCRQEICKQTSVEGMSETQEGVARIEDATPTSSDKELVPTVSTVLTYQSESMGSQASNFDVDTSSDFERINLFETVRGIVARLESTQINDMAEKEEISTREVCMCESGTKQDCACCKENSTVQRAPACACPNRSRSVKILEPIANEPREQKRKSSALKSRRQTGLPRVARFVDSSLHMGTQDVSETISVDPAPLESEPEAAYLYPTHYVPEDEYKGPAIQWNGRSGILLSGFADPERPDCVSPSLLITMKKPPQGTKVIIEPSNSSEKPHRLTISSKNVQRKSVTYCPNKSPRYKPARDDSVREVVSGSRDLNPPELSILRMGANKRCGRKRRVCESNVGNCPANATYTIVPMPSGALSGCNQTPYEMQQHQQEYLRQQQQADNSMFLCPELQRYQRDGVSTNYVSSSETSSYPSYGWCPSNWVPDRTSRIYCTRNMLTFNGERRWCPTHRCFHR